MGKLGVYLIYDKANNTYIETDAAGFERFMSGVDISAFRPVSGVAPVFTTSVTRSAVTDTSDPFYNNPFANSSLTSVVGGNDNYAISSTSGTETVVSGYQQQVQPGDGQGEQIFQSAASGSDLSVSNFTGYGDYPSNDAFGGLTAEETAALDRSILVLSSGFNEQNPFESKLSIENAVQASVQAAELLDYFGDRLTTQDRADLETIINAGRQVAQASRDVQEIVGGAVESLRQISLTSEDQTPNQIAKSISDRAFEVYGALSSDEKIVLRTLFPDLDKQLGALQNITGSQNPFAALDNFQVQPYTSQSMQPFNSTDAAVDRAVAAWIAQNGSISESEYARIESEVSNSRGIVIQQQGVSQDQNPRIDNTIRYTSATVDIEETQSSIPEFFYDFSGGGAGVGESELDVNKRVSAPVLPQRQGWLSNVAATDDPQYSTRLFGPTGPDVTQFKNIYFPDEANALKQPPSISPYSNGLPTSWLRDQNSFEILGRDTPYPMNVTYVDRVATWFTTPEQAALGSAIVEIIYRSILENTNPKSQLDVLNDANNGFVTKFLKAIGFNAAPLTGSANYLVTEVAPDTTFRWSAPSTVAGPGTAWYSLTAEEATIIWSQWSRFGTDDETGLVQAVVRGDQRAIDLLTTGIDARITLAQLQEQSDPIGHAIGVINGSSLNSIEKAEKYLQLAKDYSLSLVRMQNEMNRILALSPSAARGRLELAPGFSEYFGVPNESDAARAGLTTTQNINQGGATLIVDTTQGGTAAVLGQGGGATVLGQGGTAGGGGILNEEDTVVADDGFVLSDPDDPTSLRVSPEDQFTETDGGLFVLTEELDREVENTDPDPVDDENLYPNGLPYDDDGNLMPGWTLDEDGNPVFVGGDFVEPATQAQADAAREAAITQAATIRARSQAVIEAQRKQANEGDWRVKLRLAGGASYLYKDPEIDENGILWPLNVSDGVIFPYTPQISTNYGANYTSYDMTHSNYRGYFYQNSFVDEIQLRATFTAQDTTEANYLLAVIHFFRSVTKMFYGQDAQRGAPPPMVFLQGLGEYQFNLHPCVVKNFNYTLPNDVDYIRARSVSVNGTDLLARRDRQTLAGGSFLQSLFRLANASGGGLKPGALTAPPAPPTLGTQNPTYVPTKMEIDITLLPIQTREQISKQFSVKQFANGDLLKGGFW